MHGMLAAITATPEIALEAEEAKALAKATAEVAKHYPLNIAPEVLAWSNLAMVAIPIYGSRVYLVAQRRREERAQKAKPVTSHVVTPEPPVAGYTEPPGAFPEFKSQ